MSEETVVYHYETPQYRYYGGGGFGLISLVLLSTYCCCKKPRTRQLTMPPPPSVTTVDEAGLIGISVMPLPDAPGPTAAPNHQAPPPYDRVWDAPGGAPATNYRPPPPSYKDGSKPAAGSERAGRDLPSRRPDWTSTATPPDDIKYGL